MSAKRKHRNTTRLTAKERAEAVLRQFGWSGKSRSATVEREISIIQRAIQRALQAHARAALRRDQRRDGK